MIIASIKLYAYIVNEPIKIQCKKYQRFVRIICIYQHLNYIKRKEKKNSFIQNALCIVISMQGTLQADYYHNIRSKRNICNISTLPQILPLIASHNIIVPSIRNPPRMCLQILTYLKNTLHKQQQQHHYEVASNTCSV